MKLFFVIRSNKQWLHCRKLQFLIAYIVHKWQSWLKKIIYCYFPFFFFFWCIILLLIDSLGNPARQLTRFSFSACLFFRTKILTKYFHCEILKNLIFLYCDTTWVNHPKLFKAKARLSPIKKLKKGIAQLANL